jgi:hypothetical protein
VRNNRSYAPELAWVRYNQKLALHHNTIIRAPSFLLLHVTSWSNIIPFSFLYSQKQSRGYNEDWSAFFLIRLGRRSASVKAMHRGNRVPNALAGVGGMARGGPRHTGHVHTLVATGRRRRGPTGLSGARGATGGHCARQGGS